jgi:predicted hydrocarbon binding protein
MQGTIFTVFSDMIIETQGIETWNELLDTVQPESGGIYTRGMQYDDAELIALVTALSDKTNIDIPTLVKAFGGYLFIHLFNSSPAKVSHIDNLKDFLTCIDSVIHKEVKRVYPHAYLPSFDYKENANGDLEMIYHSKRKLCHLSEGLILGAAEHFNEKVKISQPECMHEGAEKCILLISFEQ